MPLMGKIAYDRYQYNIRDWKTYTPEPYTVPLTLAVNSLLIFFTVGLFINIGLVYLTSIRLIKFLQTSPISQRVLYFLSVPLVLIFLNENFRLMAFFWGATSFNLAESLYKSK